MEKGVDPLTYSVYGKALDTKEQSTTHDVAGLDMLLNKQRYFGHYIAADADGTRMDHPENPDPRSLTTEILYGEPKILFRFGVPT